MSESKKTDKEPGDRADRFAWSPEDVVIEKHGEDTPKSDRKNDLKSRAKNVFEK